MPVRHASRADIPAMATVVSLAYNDQPLFDLLHPHRNIYPEDWRAHWESDFRQRMNDPSKVLLVCEDIGDGEEGNGSIVGICCWQRLGELADGRKANVDVDEMKRV
jgi:hypothetical protein